MAFSVAQKSLTKPSSRQFVDFLISRNILKPGFRSVLKNRDLPQINDYLISKNLLRANQLPSLYADYFGIPQVDLSALPISNTVVRLIPHEVAKKYSVIAYDLRGKDIYLAVGNPAMLQASAPTSLLRLRQEKGLDIHLAISSKEEILSAIDHAYAGKTSTVTLPAKPTVPTNPK